jgi:hypothetical protein
LVFLVNLPLLTGLAWFGLLFLIGLPCLICITCLALIGWDGLGEIWKIVEALI